LSIASNSRNHIVGSITVLPYELAVSTSDRNDPDNKVPVVKYLAGTYIKNANLSQLSNSILGKPRSVQAIAGTRSIQEYDNCFIGATPSMADSTQYFTTWQFHVL